MENEYVASVIVSDQIGPEHYEVYTKTLKLTETNTIGEVIEWARKAGHNVHPSNVSEVRITPLRTL